MIANKVMSSTNLDVSDGVLTGNSDSVLGSHHSDLIEQSILDSSFNLLDLLNGLLVVESIKEEINIRSRTELLMIILAKLTLGSVEFFGYREKTVDD